MMKLASITLFAVLFLSVLYAMHAYAFNHLGLLFGFSLNSYWLFALAASFLVATLIDRFFHSWPTQILYAITSTEIGVLFLFCSALLLVDFLALFVSVGVYGTLVALIIVILLSAYAVWNDCRVVVKKVALTGFGKRLKIVHLSDIHVGTLRNARTLRKLIKETNGLKPDLVLITGDLVDGSGKLTNEIFSPLKKIKAPTLMCMGNHEFYEGLDAVEQLVEKSGIRILRNEATTLTGVRIIGMDYSADRQYLAKQLSKLKKSKLPTILMNHEPVGVKAAEAFGVKLMLSGHTHAGQLFPFTLIVRLFYKYLKGLYKIGKMRLYVSPGTGTWGPPMRLGSKNEITLFEVR